jgi:hypothetical protein
MNSERAYTSARRNVLPGFVRQSTWCATSRNRSQVDERQRTVWVASAARDSEQHVGVARLIEQAAGHKINVLQRLPVSKSI